MRLDQILGFRIDRSGPPPGIKSVLLEIPPRVIEEREVAPVIVFTGHLGAGKSSVLQALLKAYQGYFQPSQSRLVTRGRRKKEVKVVVSELEYCRLHTKGWIDAIAAIRNRNGDETLYNAGTDLGILAQELRNSTKVLLTECSLYSFPRLREIIPSAFRVLVEAPGIKYGGQLVLKRILDREDEQRPLETELDLLEKCRRWSDWICYSRRGQPDPDRLFVEFLSRSGNLAKRRLPRVLKSNNLLMVT